jgi:hypothetical protein
VPTAPEIKRITTPVILQIEELVKDIPGWTPIDELYALFNLIYSIAELDGDLVEVGSWCGRSTTVIGLAARLTGVRRIHCVDPFPEKKDWVRAENGNHYFRVTVGDTEIVGYNGFGGVWPEPFERDIAPLYERHNGIYAIFRDTMERKNMDDIVTAHRGNSDMFVSAMPADFRCKLAFIDGDHAYEAVRLDILNVDRFLVPGGWIAFDDAFSVYDGVSRAISELVIENPKYELAQQMTRKLFVARKRTKTGVGT